MQIFESFKLKPHFLQRKLLTATDLRKPTIILKLEYMSILNIRTSLAINVLIFILGVIAGGFFLLFGVANLINPASLETYLTMDTIVYIVTCIIGLVFFF